MIIKSREPGLRKGMLVTPNDNTPKIANDVIIDLTGDVSIGPYSEILDGTEIITHRHLWNHSRGLRHDIQEKEPVNLKIGRDVFIGIRCLIICVEEIGDGAVVGAGSVLTKNVKPYEIWAGNPARKIGERSTD